MLTCLYAYSDMLINIKNKKQMQIVGETVYLRFCTLLNIIISFEYILKKKCILKSQKETFERFEDLISGVLGDVIYSSYKIVKAMLKIQLDACSSKPLKIFCWTVLKYIFLKKYTW